MRKRFKKTLASLLAVLICVHSANLTCLAEETDVMPTEQILDVSGNNLVTPDTEEWGPDNITTGEDIFPKEMEADVSTAVYETDNYKVISTLLGSWEGGFTASILVENTGDLEIGNWYLKFPAPFEISDIWNAQIAECEDGEYLVKNVGWNTNIPAGGCVQFGITVGESFTQFPSTYELMGTNQTTSEENYEVVFEVASDWGTGFSGTLRLDNRTDTVIENWILEFDYENEISSLWNGVISSHEGNHYIVRNAEYNRDIPVGGSVCIGFQVSEGSSGTLFSDMSLSGFSLTPAPTAAPGDGKEPLQGLGEIYIKESSEEDIVHDIENCADYVRNQLTVNAYLGTPKSVMEEIAAEIDATVVGYIELAAYYQLEFGHDMTYDELDGMAQYLSSFPFIDFATFNYATPVQMNYESNDELYTNGTLWTTEHKESAAHSDELNDSTAYEIETLDNQDDGWNPAAPDGNNWGLEAMNVCGAWDYRDSFRGPVKVGIYDNMFSNTEDLEFDVICNNPDTINKVHGTHVAGTIAAKFDNGIGISGVATDVELYGYSVAKTNAKRTKIYTSLITSGVRVINVSQGYFDEYVYATTQGNEKIKENIENEAKDLSDTLKNLILQGYDFLIVNSAGNGNKREYVEVPGSDYGYEIYDSEENKYDGLTPIEGNPDAFYNLDLSAITDPIVKSRILVVGAASHKRHNNFSTYSAASFSNRGDRVDVYAPGVDILSTIPEGIIGDNKYMTLSGTSMAAPHISGLAALILQANPTLTAPQVKNIIVNNKGNRVTVDGNNTYYMPDAQKCIETALNAPGGSKIYEPNLPHGILKGKVTDNNGQTLQGMTVTLVRTSTGESNLEDYYFTTQTKTDGTYEISLTQGTYEMVIYGEFDVLPFRMGNIVIYPDAEKYLETAVLFAPAKSMVLSNASICGVVYDALSGEAISGATINLRSGWNSFSESYAVGVLRSSKKTKTNANGEFTIKACCGQYTVEIQKDGYIIGYFNMISTLNSSQARQKVILTPTLPEDEYRVILTWGATPTDLDSHLTYHVGENQKFHVYYSDKQGAIDGKTVAKLDLDDTTSYGPETITIDLTDELLENGLFRYSVQNFTDRNNPSSTRLASSGAMVRVYSGNHLLETFHVPENEAGTVWCVFTLDKSGLKPRNYIYSAGPTGVM